MSSSQITGAIVLVCLGILMLVANGFLYPMPTWWAPDEGEVILLYGAAGIILSEAGIITSLAVLWAETLLRRAVFLCSSVCALICAVWLGYLMTMPVNESLASLNSEFAVVVAGFAPGFLVASMTPFVVVRWFKRVISNREMNQSGSASIAGIMMFTAAVALAIGGVELASHQLMLDTPAEKWGNAGIVLAIAFCVSLLGALPVMLAMRSGKTTTRMSLVLIYAALAGFFACAIASGIESGGARYFPKQLDGPGVPLFVITSVCCASFSAYFIGLRLLGFRLQKLVTDSS
ncbi:MAG: hypothetical protein AAF456_23995 [Planctomycetota bacterium]